MFRPLKENFAGEQTIRHCNDQQILLRNCTGPGLVCPLVEQQVQEREIPSDQWKRIRQVVLLVFALQLGS